MQGISKHAGKLGKESVDLYFLDADSNRTRQHLFVIKELTAREIKRKYARSYLGIVWSVLNPLLNMIVMSLIFSYMFRHSIENFPVYYLIGSTIWTLFRTATDSSMTVLADNKQLLVSAKLPRYVFVLSRIYTAIVNFFYTLIPLMLIIHFFKIELTWNILLIIPDLICLIFFATGIGLTLSVIYIFFADIKYLYEILLTIWMYLSALFYPVERLPDFMQKVLGFNPIYLSINIARCVVLYGTLPCESEWIKLIAYSIVVFTFGVFCFVKLEADVIKKI